MINKKSMVLLRSTSIYCTLMPVSGSNGEQVSDCVVCCVSGCG